MAERAPGHVRPFSSGSEGADWREANCERCQRKGEPDANGDGPCPMETAVARGFVLGTIPADLAVEYGATLDKQPGYCTMPRECGKLLIVSLCEWTLWVRTRRAKRCGKDAALEVPVHGRRRRVCAEHFREFNRPEPEGTTA